jgi:hypothetical protein
MSLLLTWFALPFDESKPSLLSVFFQNITLESRNDKFCKANDQVTQT